MLVLYPVKDKIPEIIFLSMVWDPLSTKILRKEMIFNDINYFTIKSELIILTIVKGYVKSHFPLLFTLISEMYISYSSNGMFKWVLINLSDFSKSLSRTNFYLTKKG